MTATGVSQPIEGPLCNNSETDHTNSIRNTISKNQETT